MQVQESVLGRLKHSAGLRALQAGFSRIRSGFNSTLELNRRALDAIVEGDPDEFNSVPEWVLSFLSMLFIAIAIFFGWAAAIWFLPKG